MKKRLIILVIVAMAVSLLGLIAFQLYWIRNAMAMEEMNFDRNVSEAVGRAIQKFNNQLLAQKMVTQQERDRELFQQMDSLNHLYYRQMMGAQLPGGSAGLQGQPDGMEQDDDPVARWMGSGDDDPGATAGRSQGYLPGPGNMIPDDPVAFFFERSQMIDNLFRNMFSNRYSYQVSPGENVHALDSLLKKEFQNLHIKSNYEFGLVNPNMNVLYWEKSGEFTEQLLQSQYAYSLFPSDMFMNPDYLLLYFPDHKQHVISRMNAMMATSTLFIIIIISSFAFTIMTVIRQKKLSQMKTDFINNMTHELKTPISTISLACQALSDRDINKSEVLYQNYINMINEENQRLGMMTEKVLQTALIDKGRLRLHATGIDVHELINNAIGKIGLQIEARGGRITTSLDATHSFIKADKIHLANVFFNLLDNANKYSPVNPVVHVSTENLSNGVLVHVDDNGVGISRANQKKIFDNLYRIPTGNIHDVKGFGLGLSYVKAITEQHGGWVTVQSEPKKGSRFSVFIPFGLNGSQAKNMQNRTTP